ncbi:4'-phosphopantetheinyl transferase superfamily protein [Myxococcota bacterium]|nr:4'-phosphopantetheinyl transferase superfamily protein [Myxococcota bacterium]
MLEKLFPAEVRWARAHEQVESEPLHRDEAKAAAAMAPKRLREYTLGRACARKVLHDLGVEGFALCNDADRVPIWPSGITGSLTHCKGLCIAVAAHREHVLGIGVDAEPRRTLSKGVLDRISSESERRHLACLPAVPEGGDGDWGLLLFSAKESFYKCYYPLTRRFLHFRDAQVEFQPETGRFSVSLANHEAPSAQGVRRLWGRFQLDVNHIVTGVVLQPKGAAPA